MKNYSVLPARNLQFIQYIPEKHSLKLGVHQMDGTIASQAPIIRYNTLHLFTLPQNLKDEKAEEPFFLEFEPITDQFRVFPNPARDYLKVSFEVSAAEEVSTNIYNLLGALVSSQRFLCTEGVYTREIDISDLQQGTYLLQVSSSDRIITRKITLVK